MATYLSAGVYPREADVSAYAAAVASSVVALVGTASKGPFTPTLITSPDQWVKVFGKPLPTAANRSNFGPHAAVNALNQTSQVWYQRVGDGSQRAASTSSPVIINSQVVYLAKDDAGIDVVGGQMAFTLEIRKRAGSSLGADAFNALTRTFGLKSVFTATYAQITNLDELNTAIAGGGAFVNVAVPLAKADKHFENVDQFVGRFNSIMIGSSGALRAETLTVNDPVDGVLKFLLIKTNGLADLLALNLEFHLIDDSSTISPSQTGYATHNYDGGQPNSQLQVTAKKPGILGNGISVVFTDVGNTFSGLPPVSISGLTINVSINEGVTTAADVVSAMDNNSTARLMVSVVNGAGSDGSATIQHGTVNLTAGGTNLPAQIINPADDSIGTVNLSTTWTQRYEPTSTLAFNFYASTDGEYANVAKLSFGKDDSGLETFEYREGNEAPERAVNLRIQPAGVKGSFIDAVNSFSGVAEIAAADITLLTALASQTLARGTIDSITDLTARTWMTWNAFEFYDAASPGFTGGRSGIPDDYNDIVDEVIGNPADKSGLYAFADRTRFNNSLLAAPGFDQSAVIRAGLGVADTSGEMEFLVDCPAGQQVANGLTAQEVVDWHNGRGFGNSAAFNTSFGALYYGWQLTQDLFNDVSHWVPPSVLVLEQICYSDKAAEVWFAPAGTRRGLLLRSLGTQANATCSQGERDYMYSGGNAVNPIVNFPGVGVAIWGQRTLQRAASALDRINVRRMLNYIKRASVEAANPSLFEPNDEVLWNQLSRVLTPIYQEVKNKRGINRFEVKIDSSTTDNAAKDRNEVYGYIIVEPTNAAEKIILTFVLTAQGASFSEALAAVGVA